jgi:hypothetical protein
MVVLDVGSSTIKSEGFNNNVEHLKRHSKKNHDQIEKPKPGYKTEIR